MAAQGLVLGLVTVVLYLLVSEHHHAVSLVLTDDASPRLPSSLWNILRGSTRDVDSASQQIPLKSDSLDGFKNDLTVLLKTADNADRQHALDSASSVHDRVVDEQKSFEHTDTTLLENTGDAGHGFAKELDIGLSVHDFLVAEKKDFNHIDVMVGEQEPGSVDAGDEAVAVKEGLSVDAPVTKGQQRVCLHGVESGAYVQTACRVEEPAVRLLPEDTTVIEVTSLPLNAQYMPEVGNGHVATVVMGNAVYMNGLYNGANVSSHRARIPSRAAVMATIISPASGWKTKYRMDFGRGVFSEIHTADDFTVMVNRYAHRELTRLLVTEVIVNRTVTSRPVTIAFTVNNGSESEDIDFQQKGQGMMSGKTREPEYPDMSPTTDVTVVYSEVLPNMTFDSIVQAYMPFFTSVSTSSSDAIDYFNKGMSRMANGTLYSSHVAAWDSVWQNGRIDLTGNTTMALSTYATLYYLLSSVPLKPDSQWPFVGMAPGGLAHGAAGKDYEGHVFWDQDTWMFPPIMLLHADIGRIIVGTRLRTHQAALKYANMTGYSGARYPWESAFTGLNVSPSVATTVYENHITGDTAWMMRQYLQQTNDTKFLTTDGGYQALSDIAKYWLSRVTFSKTTSLYEIRDVMGPDEWHSPVNNSAYTNVIAAQALYTAIDAASLIKQTPPDDWLKVAQNMYIPFDSEKNFHPEYDDYKTGTNVKQADTIMLGFPLEWPMSAEVRANDLKYYATVTPSGPAMTWGMFAANWLRVGRSNKVKADAAFYKGTYNIQDPFKVWSENADGTGAMNFHTGMGGYLQSLLFGYAGFDFNDQHLGLNPMLPPSLTQVSVTGFDYGGDSLDLSYDADHMNVTVTKHTGRPMVLQLLVDQTLHNLDLGVTVTAQCQPAYILRPVT